MRDDLDASIAFDAAWEDDEDEDEDDPDAGHFDLCPLCGRDKWIQADSNVCEECIADEEV